MALTHEQKLAFIHKMTKMGLDHTSGVDPANYLDAGGSPTTPPGGVLPTSANGPGVTATGPTANMSLGSNTQAGFNNAINPIQGLNPAQQTGNEINDIQSALTNNFTASAANTQAGTTTGQLNQAYTGAQNALNDQNALTAQTQPGVSQGVTAQSALSQQLAAEAAGQGPNPAQAALNQATGQNIAQQAALAANTRGASTNAGQIATNNAQQGAATQQAAVGQAATLSAQQQIAAQQQEQQLAAQQVGQGQVATTAENQTQQNEQNILQGTNTAYNNTLVSGQNNINSVNAGVAQGNQATTANIFGGLTSGVSSLASLFAKGGMVKMDAGGNVLDTAARDKIPTSDFALPGRRYPIHDANHARNALARVSQNGTPEEKRKVQSAVKKKYPEMAKMCSGGAVKMADGGDVSGQADDTTVIPDKGYGKIIITNDQQSFASGGDVSITPLQVNNPYGPQSNTGQWLNSNVNTGGGVQSSSSGLNPVAENKMGLSGVSPSNGSSGALNFDDSNDQIVSGGGDDIPGGSQANVNPDQMYAAKGGLAAKGGPVNAKNKKQMPIKAGDSLENDKVPAMLSAGEVVIDRETMADKGPVGQMARAVAMHIKKKNGGK